MIRLYCVNNDDLQDVLKFGAQYWVWPMPCRLVKVGNLVCARDRFSSSDPCL